MNPYTKLQAFATLTNARDPYAVAQILDRYQDTPGIDAVTSELERYCNAGHGFGLFYFLK